MTAAELRDKIDKEIAPFSSAESWDNCGLLAGDPSCEVTAALICLDITRETIEEAVQRGANLLVSHHPVIFHPLRGVLSDGVVHRLIREGLTAICAHTNLDLARGGVNDCLARALRLSGTEPLEPPAPDTGLSLGRVGTLPAPMLPGAFAEYVRDCLLPGGGVRYTSGGSAVSRVAVCGGAGGSLARRAAEVGAQAIVTSEIKHDVLLDCAAMGITAVDAGHFDTECVVLAPLAERLAQLSPGTAFIVSRQKSPLRCVC